MKTSITDFNSMEALPMFSLFNDKMELLAYGSYSELVTFAKVELLALYSIIPTI
jgi:hypothetical protein